MKNSIKYLDGIIVEFTAVKVDKPPEKITRDSEEYEEMERKVLSILLGFKLASAGVYKKYCMDTVELITTIWKFSTKVGGLFDKKYHGVWELFDYSKLDRYLDLLLIQLVSDGLNARIDEDFGGLKIDDLKFLQDVIWWEYLFGKMFRNGVHRFSLLAERSNFIRQFGSVDILSRDDAREILKNPDNEALYDFDELRNFLAGKE